MALDTPECQHRDRLPLGPESFTRSCLSPQGAPTCTLHPGQRTPPDSTAAMPPRINIPPVTRILLITLGLQSILSAAIRYKQWSANSEIVIPYLNLIPQLSLIYPWTFLTTTLVESNVFTLAIAVVTLYYGGRYLERAWSSKEFAKFLLITALIPNTLCFGVMVTFFTVTRNESWTYVAQEVPPLPESQQLTASLPFPGSPPSPARSLSRSASSLPSANSSPPTPSPYSGAYSPCAYHAFPSSTSAWS